MAHDPGLLTLLDLHDSILVQERGYWIKIEAWTVAPTDSVPHGIRYSLTLHNRYNTRVLGYDNAHAVKPPGRFKYAGQKLAHDHKHRTSGDQGVPYGFQSAEQLLNDFFTDVDRVIEEEKAK